MPVNLNIVGDAEADALLSNDPLALLIGMLCDQQYPMEAAFAAPKKIADRMGGLDLHRIAESDVDEFASMCSVPPAIHRYPGSMAKRIHELCHLIIDRYDSRPDAIWTEGDPNGKEVLKRLKALPGYGDQKARIFLAILGKQYEVQPDGWREAAGDYGLEGSRRSVADVTDLESLAEVRAFKKEAKAAAKAAKP